MGAKAIGSLAVNIIAKTSRFQKDVDKARKKAKSFGSGIKSLGKKILGFGSVLTGVSVGGFALFLKAQAESIDKIAKQADLLNMSTENLSAWTHFAAKAGIAGAEFNSSLMRMTRRIGLFAKEGGAAAERLGSLGFKFKEIGALGPEAQFAAIAEAIKKLPTHAERSAAAFEIFGMSGQKLLPLLAQGAEGIKKMREEGDALGITFSREQARKVEQFNDAMADLQAIIGGMGKQIVIKFAPAVLETVQGIQLAIKNWGKVSAVLTQELKSYAAWFEKNFAWTIQAAKGIGGLVGAGRAKVAAISERVFGEGAISTAQGPNAYGAQYRQPFSDEVARQGLEEHRKHTELLRKLAEERDFTSTKYAFHN